MNYNCNEIFLGFFVVFCMSSFYIFIIKLFYTVVFLKIAVEG
jgi:hypothetical protein